MANTEHYNFPLYRAGEKPRWDVEGWNGVMENIDSNLSDVNTKADTANSNAIEAKNNADSANSNATAAKNIADTANSNATAALTKGQEAYELAEQVQSSVSEVNTKADNASQLASEANSKADNASQLVSEANTKADNASQLANEANTKADNANQSISSLDSRVGSIENDITGLDTRVTALEQGGGSGGGGIKDIYKFDVCCGRIYNPTSDSSWNYDETQIQTVASLSAGDSTNLLLANFISTVYSFPILPTNNDDFYFFKIYRLGNNGDEEIPIENYSTLRTLLLDYINQDKCKITIDKTLYVMVNNKISYNLDYKVIPSYIGTTTQSDKMLQLDNHFKRNSWDSESTDLTALDLCIKVVDGIASNIGNDTNNGSIYPKKNLRITGQIILSE